MEDVKRRVKKPRKRVEEHGASHGSWKVAYADFVTAMMAFFLMLWLLTMTSSEQKARLSTYFRYFSIFDKSAGSPVNLSDESSRPIAVTENERSGKDEKANDGNEDIENKGSTPPRDILSEEQKREELQSRLKKIIESELADVKSQVLVDGFKNSVRIQMVDEEGSMMFPTGSTTMTPRAREIIKVLTQTMKDFSGPISIEGHTDARLYPSQQYTNWELSVDRATAARKEMVTNGLNPDQIVRITGFADKKPIYKEDPLDPRNRRISILLYKPKPKITPVIEPNAISRSGPIAPLENL